MNCANHPDRERVAFCQNCGKPLCQECTRVIGSAVFCEPCLAARLAGAGASPNASASSSYSYGSGPAGVNYAVDGIAPPPAPGAASPALATLLGFIPGVGAMYNGQYAKGVVHLVVFAILVSLANDVNGIFGLFVAGWIVYQAIEANHTARAKLAGTPLPNPFGLNDLGERLGFGKAWPAAAPFDPSTGSPTADPSTEPDMSGQPASSYSPPPAQSAPPPAANWSAPTGSYSYYGAPPIPPVPPYGTPYPSDDLANQGHQRNRIPTGAIWLIGLGVFFLIANTGLFHPFMMRYFVPFLLIGVGVWLFVRKMMDTGPGLADDGTQMYQIRLFRALRGSVWVTLVGVLFLLHDFNILTWGHSWPLFIIVAGLMTVFQRATYRTPAYPGYAYPPAAPVPSPEPAPTSTAIVPSSTHDQEGR